MFFFTFFFCYPLPSWLSSSFPITNTSPIHANYRLPSPSRSSCFSPLRPKMTSLARALELTSHLFTIKCHLACASARTLLAYAALSTILRLLEVQRSRKPIKLHWSCRSLQGPLLFSYEDNFILYDYDSIEIP